MTSVDTNVFPVLRKILVGKTITAVSENRHEDIILHTEEGTVTIYQDMHDDWKLIVQGPMGDCLEE